jgi:hypothetical protein
VFRNVHFRFSLSALLREYHSVREEVFGQMWCRDASYALRHGVNTRKREMLAEVSGGTCEVVLRGVIPEERVTSPDPAARSLGKLFPQRNQRLAGRSASALLVNPFQSGA